MSTKVEDRQDMFLNKFGTDFERIFEASVPNDPRFNYKQKNAFKMDYDSICCI